MAMKPEVLKLLALGRMPSDHDAVAETTVKDFRDALDGLQRQGHPLTDEEAAALLDIFPEGEYGGLFEMEWTLLHAIESAPYGPGFLAQLDGRSRWVEVLRKRADRAGLL